MPIGGKKRLAKGSILSRPSALEGCQIGAEDIMRKDVIVLGAGIVGVSVAVHLQQRGRSVLLVDRRGPGEETSYGNAGPDPARRRLSVWFPARFRRAAALCDEPHHRCALSSRGPAETGAFPVSLLDAFAPRRASGDRKALRPAHRTQRDRTCGIGRGCRRHRPHPPDRLDESLPQPESPRRPAPRRRGDEARFRSEFRSLRRCRPHANASLT